MLLFKYFNCLTNSNIFNNNKLFFLLINYYFLFFKLKYKKKYIKKINQINSKLIKLFQNFNFFSKKILNVNFILNKLTTILST